MVMDPRFAKCEMAWYKKMKVTGSEHGYQEQGIMVVADDGTLTSSRLISIEQYAEMLGEGRHFLKQFQDYTNTTEEQIRQVNTWEDARLLELVKRECPNYFTKEGKANDLALVLVEMFKADWLGLILDYAEVSNLDQWVFVETGDVAHDTSIAAAEQSPIAQAEIEYLDRALMYRAVLRANAIKVVSKIGGNQLKEMIDGVQLTEFEKDVILQEVFSYPFDELYKALNVVLYTVGHAKMVPYEQREAEQLGLATKLSKQHVARLRSGEIKALDLLDGNTGQSDDEAKRFSLIRHDENLVTMFYILTQAEALVTEYPKMQAVVDICTPLLDKAEPIPDDEFKTICEKIQDLTDEATSDPEVCQERIV
jgi:hypothetical protein